MRYLPIFLCLAACATLPPTQPRPPGGYAQMQFLETVSITRFYEIPAGAVLTANRGPGTYCGLILNTPAIGGPEPHFACYRHVGDKLVDVQTGHEIRVPPSSYKLGTL